MGLGEQVAWVRVNPPSKLCPENWGSGKEEQAPTQTWVVLIPQAKWLPTCGIAEGPRPGPVGRRRRREVGEGRPLWRQAGVVLRPLRPWPLGRLVSAFGEKREERQVESLSFN
jgi:hypothetical protein